MKNYFFIDCRNVMDIVYDEEEDIPVFLQIQLNLHILFCETCTVQVKTLQKFKEVVQNDFFPPSPQVEDLIMEKLYMEADYGDLLSSSREIIAEPAGFSIKSWIIIGLIVLLSLTAPVLGLNFSQIAASEGSSFLLPIGLTIGLIVTCYGAIFIGSHLKELSDRFGLR